MRVNAAIDLWIDFLISQTLQMVIGGNVTIRVDACCLNAPVPHVPINIIGEVRRSEDNAEAEDAPKPEQ